MFFIKSKEISFKDLHLCPNFNLDVDGSFMPFDCTLPKDNCVSGIIDNRAILFVNYKRQVQMDIIWLGRRMRICGECTPQEFEQMAKMYVEGL